jgi:hypothetical protein
VDRRRLALAILLTDRARLLASLAFVAVFFAVIGLVALAGSLLPFGSGPSLVIPLTIFFGLPYIALVIETLRGLRRSALRDRAIRLGADAGVSLQAHVAQTAQRISVPTPQQIWVSYGFDLSPVSRGDRYDLVIGLAILDVLTAEEFGAYLAVTLARAFGDDRLAARAYRSIQGWVDVALARPSAVSIGAVVAKVIALRCMTMLSADAVVSSRETYARALVTRLWGESALAAAMLRPAMYRSYADDIFWPDLLKRHAANIEPPDAMSQHRAMCRSPLPTEESLRRLNSAAGELEIKVEPGSELARAVTREVWPTASETLASTLQAPLTVAFDMAWRAGITPGWAEMRAAAARSAAELDSLEVAAARGPLSDAQELRRLELIDERDGPATALPLYRAWLERHPSNAMATFRTGYAALRERAADGIPLLEHAMELDPRFRAESCGLIAEELRAQGRESEAESYRVRQSTALAELEKALTARAKDKSSDSLIAPDLSDQEIDTIVRHLQKFKMIIAATVVRRDVRQFPTIPCLELAIRFDRWWSWMHSERIDGVLAAAADVPLPMQILPRKASAKTSRPPAVEIYRVPPLTRGQRLARWGRRGQVVLIPIALFLVLRASFQNRNCFPECWLKPEAFFYLVPLIVAINVFLLTGSPDTPPRRAAAFLASVTMVTMMSLSGWWLAFTPLPFVALLRVPTTRRSLIWTAALSAPAVLIGVLVANS